MFTNKLNNINSQIQQLTEQFKHRFPLDNNTITAIHGIGMGHHQKPAHPLTGQTLSKKKKAEPDHNQINNKFVYNMSCLNLTKAERSILVKGLNYAITEKNAPLGF